MATRIVPSGAEPLRTVRTVLPAVRGERVTLRPYAAGFDEEALRVLYRWARDGEILELSGGMPIQMPFGRFRDLFLTQLPRRNGGGEELFAVLDEHHRLIGRTGLFRIGRLARTAELGIVIGERDAWGHGYGRDAVRTLARHGLANLGLDRIVLYTFPDNVRAQRAFAAAGFRHVRTLRRFTIERGTHEEVEMEMRRGAAAGARSPNGAR